MKYVLVLVSTLFIISCNRQINQIYTIDPAYQTEIEEHRKTRLANLTKPDGWLSVVALHWLEEGINSIGAADDNKFIFPNISTETIGAYQKQGDKIFFGKVQGVHVTNGNVEYMGGPVQVTYPPEVISHESLNWYIIKRGGKYGIRLKDSLADNRLNFTGVDNYSIDKKYRIEADIIAPTKKDSVKIVNVLGQESYYLVSAYLEFNKEGKTYSLIALDEGGPNYFLIFSDETTGDSTYGGGRFLYPNKPINNGNKTWLDFNKAVSPPCAFSDFATCPLPPEQNKLQFKVLAGERMKSTH